jgi:prepilin-type processing-associated H-X9-DG protein
VPKVLICPEDEAPANGHTYALNNPPAANHCTLGRHNFAGLTVDQVVIAAEKSYHSAHYYLEPNEADYNETLDLVHHGRKHGSNYLFFDSHVETRLPPMQENMDPWTTHGVGVQSIPPSP